MPSPTVWASFWYSALNERVGLYLRTPDPNRLKSILYSARAKTKDPALAHLQLRTSPSDPKGEIFIFNPHSLGER